jgi:hypothetical protein
MKGIISNLRVEFLSWVIIPCVGLWVAVSYLIGIAQPPEWQRGSLANDQTVLSERTKRVFAAQKAAKLQWDGNALISLWFDDAWTSQFTIAYPKMDDLGFTGSIAIPTKSLGTTGYMSWAQLERLAYARWEIDSHTRSHTCDIKGLSSDTATSEIVGSKQDLESFGYSPLWFVSPCGVDSPLWKDTVKNHYLGFRGVENGLNPLPMTDTYRVHAKMADPSTTIENVNSWIEEAKSTKSWLIIVFHQIDTSNSQYSVTPDTFSKMMDAVKESKVPVVLPDQVLQLVVN